MRRATFAAAAVALLGIQVLHAQEAVIEVPASESAGFNFPYFLYIPKDASKTDAVRLLVEPNNTGQTSDDLEVHRAAAKRVASTGEARRLSDRLNIPVLVPAFPRPRSLSKVYTHYLDRDSLQIKDGPLKRIDLQLLSMIRHARRELSDRGIATKPQVFMHGFSASAGFVNRFATLHPDAVRALAVGAINALPMYPIESYQGVRLDYPLGIANIEALTGSRFDRDAHSHVSQFLFMGYLDRNDTFPFTDSWDDDERDLIARLFGREMMPDRWDRAQKIIAELKLPIQAATYNGVAHRTLPEMFDDMVAFFKANDEGDGFTRIAPHEYPFVPFVPLKVGHIDRLYWRDDPDLVKHFRNLPDPCSFVIGIQDWMAGQDNEQLRSLMQKAGFEFELVPEGGTPVPIDRQAFCGFVSSGSGSIQGFQVCLGAAADRIVPGATYSLRPKQTRGEYHWSLLPGVSLKRAEKAPAK